MATSTSSDLPGSLSMSRPEYLSTLPPWRRLLARLNWHPAYEIERLAAIESKMLALLRNADSSTQAPVATDNAN